MKATIVQHATVVRDGMHNAFTSMVYWRESYWIAYRKGPWHNVSESGKICLSASVDGVRFDEVSETSFVGDNRDPFLLVTPDDKLALAVPSVRRGPGNGNFIQQYIMLSDNGLAWTQPQEILEPRHHLFSIRQREGVYYGMSSWRHNAERRLYLYESSDLFEWRRICQIGVDEDFMNESDILFNPDGSAIAISRTQRQNRQAKVSFAQPPYTEWKTEELGLKVDCPVLFWYRDAIFLVGRHFTLGDGSSWPYGSTTMLWRFDGGRLEQVLQIPSAGDNAYPGVVVNSESGFVCVSYYSQHAYLLGVLPPFGAWVCEKAEGNEMFDAPMMNDVYFVKIALSL